VPPDSLKRTLLFLHIPKTGGATITGVLSTRFAEEDCLPLYLGPPPELSDLDRFRYVTGHFTASFIRRFRRPPYVVTFLREPIERSLSSYSYLQGLTPEYVRSLALLERGEDAQDRLLRCVVLTRALPIEEIIRTEPKLANEFFGNRQARVLGGTDSRGGGESLNRALEGLERCDFVGLSDRLDESVSWLMRRLGWRDLSPLPRTNVTSERVHREQLSPEALATLREFTAIDDQLYRHAIADYERRIADWGSAGDPRDRDADIPDAQAVEDLRFDQAIPGAGWVARERVGEEPSFAWIGDSRAASVELVSRGAADSLRVEISHVLDRSILESLRISVDGAVVPHALSSMDGVVVATAPLTPRRWRRRPRVSRVTLEVDRTARPSDLDPASRDDRELSIAVRRISLQRA
jgi:hypothetical protein